MIMDTNDDMPTIDTGNGYQNNLIATTNDRLKKTVVELRKLQATIIDLDLKNGKLQGKVFYLTIIAVILSLLQLVQVIDIVLGWLGGK